MAQPNEGKNAGEALAKNAKPAAETPAQPALAERVEVEVVHLKRDKKRKKKRKYSRGTRTLQELTRGMNRASARLARAFAVGFESFYKSSDKSARKRRDGAIIDFAENWARAVGKSARVASRAPYDVARSLPKRGVRRQARAALRVTFPILWLR